MKNDDSRAGASVRFMTYNIRFDAEGDRAHGWGWNTRRGRVAALIRNAAPDVAGLQEVLHHQLEYLSEALPSYAWIGAGRDDGRQAGEYAPVFYRQDRFEAVLAGTFWLSETPDVPGSRSRGASHRRIATWAKLRERGNGREFCFFNTHFDHESALAREQSALLLKRKAAEIGGGLPCVIAGDFNCLSSDPARRGLTDGAGISLCDVLGDGPQPPTYRDFDIRMTAPRSRIASIDTLLLTPDWRLQRTFLDETHDDSSWPSDHVAILAEVAFDLCQCGGRLTEKRLV